LLVDDRTIEGLKKNEFYFTSPKAFNDPFDCKNIFTFEGSNDNDFRLFFREQLKHQQPKLSPKERMESVEAVIKKGIHRKKETQIEQLKRWKNILEEESHKIGVVCFSQKPNDILMWSHYSNKHSGICLEFDKEILESRFFCGRVQYSQQYPTFKKFVSELIHIGQESVYKMFLLTKSKHWKYEKEFRLIEDPSSRKDLPGERKYKYPEEALIGVIWGCQTSEEDKEKIRDALKPKTHKITYYLAKKSESAYAVKIEKA